MVLLPLLALASAEDCEQPTHNPAVATAIDEADTAWTERRFEEFSLARDEAVGIAVCLGEIITIDNAAGLHRLDALEAHRRKQSNQTILALRAMYRAKGYARLSSEVAAPGTELAGLDAAARTAADPTTAKVDVPLNHQLWIDGASDKPMAEELPRFVQVTTEGGTIVATRVLGPGDTLPTWAELGVDAAMPDDNPKKKHPLLWAAGGAAVVAGGLYGGAMGARGAFDDPATARGDLEGLRGTTNGLVISSAVVAAAALGLGTVAIVTW